MADPAKNEKRDAATMKGRFCRRLLPLLFSAALISLVGCSLMHSLVFPPKYDRTSLLTPQQDVGEGYAVEEDGTVSYAVEGMRIDVKQMTDRELNEMFPDISAQGAYSHNPYTYGDHLDPVLGYVPNRFTVFRVTIHNHSFAKVELQPLRSLLTTNRQGELLEPYGVLSGSAPKSFESYYRALRGPSGNEYYRFDMRMGIVRTNNYAIDEKIFKGESYAGFIVFDPLDDEVENVRLLLRDFVLKFNAFGKPLQTTDVEFGFDRKVTSVVLEAKTALASSREMSRAELSAPSRVVGNVTGDETRDVSAVDALARTQLTRINQCFEREFAAGTASEGEVAVELVILPLGVVESARIASSTVLSDAVDRCIVNQVKQWRFIPSTGRAPEPAGADSVTVAQPRQVLQNVSYRVTATCYFEFIDIRP